MSQIARAVLHKKGPAPKRPAAQSFSVTLNQSVSCQQFAATAGVRLWLLASNAALSARRFEQSNENARRERQQIDKRSASSRGTGGDRGRRR